MSSLISIIKMYIYFYFYIKKANHASKENNIWNKIPI